MAAVLALVLGVQLGRGAAYLVCGAGWVFPDRSALFTGLPGILTGDPAAGLDRAPGTAPAGSVLWSSVAVAELAVVFAVAAVGRFCWTRWGPGLLPGVASRAEVALLLGTRRLRRSARVVRPDLYGRDDR